MHIIRLYLMQIEQTCRTMENKTKTEKNMKKRSRTVVLSQNANYYCSECSRSDIAKTVRDCEHVGVTKGCAGSENLLCLSKDE